MDFFPSDEQMFKIQGNQWQFSRVELDLEMHYVMLYKHTITGDSKTKS